MLSLIQLLISSFVLQQLMNKYLSILTRSSTTQKFDKDISKSIKHNLCEFEQDFQNSIEFIQSHNKQVQFNIFEDYQQESLDGEEEQNKQKKKKRKNRKKKNKKNLENDNTIVFEQIYQKIYTNQQTFQQLKNDIFRFIQQTPSQDKYINILNQSVANYIKIIKAQIDKYLNKLIKPSIDRNQCCPQFCIILIYKLHEQFERIKMSSSSLQNIINMYFEFYKKNRFDYIKKCKYLQQSTYKIIFKKLIKENPQFQDFLGFCQRFSKDQRVDHLQHEQIIIKLRQMVDIFKDNNKSFQELFDLSTDHSSSLQSKKSNSKKKKNKENVVNVPQLYNEQQIYSFYKSEEQHLDILLDQLSNLKLPQYRVKVQFDASWLLQLSQKYTNNI